MTARTIDISSASASVHRDAHITPALNTTRVRAHTHLLILTKSRQTAHENWATGPSDSKSATTLLYIYIASWPLAFTLPNVDRFSARAGFISVQTARPNRIPANLGVLTFRKAICPGLVNIFLHHCPRLHPRKGITKPKMKEEGIKSQGPGTKAPRLQIRR